MGWAWGRVGGAGAGGLWGRRISPSLIPAWFISLPGVGHSGLNAQMASINQAIYDHWLLFFLFQHLGGVLWVGVGGHNGQGPPPHTHTHTSPQAPQPKITSLETIIGNTSHYT